MHVWRNPWQWLRAHPYTADGLLASAATIVNLLGMTATDYAGYSLRGPDALAVALAVVGAAPLVLRRRFPVSVLLAVAGAYFAQGFLDYNSAAGGVVVLFATYTLGAYAPVWSGLLLVVVQAAASIAYLFAKAELVKTVGLELTPVILLLVAAQFPGVWIIGRTLRARRRYLAELENRAERLERTAAVEVRVALAEERARVARELHDVVAHHVSVMTVQAAAARRTLNRDPDRSSEAMRAVEDTGRAALDEMRRIVGALRTADRSADRASDGSDESTEPDADVLSPQAGVAELPPLLERAREAGLEVELTVLGESRRLPASIDLAIYRVVQEALTNTLKHAGPTRARVMLRYEPDAVTVAVTDDGGRRTFTQRTAPGAAAAAANGASSGHGLIGMRERVSLNGGTLRTGPRAAGGFQVSARMPIESMAKDH
ncbi:sensor histidine kinase [Flindersiella endophytica]